MKTIRDMKKILWMGLIGIMLTACHWEQDVAPMLSFQLREGEKLITIAEMLEYHELGDLDSYDSLPKGTVITGIVTSDDTEGNFYKILNIQDETAGIQIKIANSSLHTKYPIGQRIYVRCDGLVLGDYRRLPQLGWWVNGGMTAIAASSENQYFFRDGAVGAEPEPIVLSSIPNNISEVVPYCNMLVKIENCYFEMGGKSAFADPNASASRTLKLNGGGSVIVRTSNYASFATNILPEGNGDVYGVLTRYNSDFQLIIRSLNDLKNFSKMEEVFKTDMANNPFNSGWKAINSGAEWKYLSNSMFQGFIINGSTAENDSWLISPAIALSKCSNGEVSLGIEHRIPNNMGNKENMKIYYSNNANVDEINESDWTELTLNTYPGEFEISNFSLSNMELTDNFRIAFRYKDSNTSAWYIKNIAIKARVSQ